MSSGAETARPRIGVVDYGAGNMISIGQAVSAVGADVVIASEPGDLEGLAGLIVPGVGAAAPAMVRLGRRRLVDPIRAWIAADRPYLGICLGLQLLFDGSDEDGAETFGILAGRTERLAGAPTLPHIGWNQVERRREHPLFDSIPDGSDFYFVHSYAGALAASDEDAAAAFTIHGAPFVSVVARGSTLGVQFHPERSGDDGLRLLANFVGLAAAAT